MTQHKRRNLSPILPDAENAYQANWAKLIRQPQLDTPAVTSFSSTLSTTAAASQYTWQPVANYPEMDRYNMIGSTQSIYIRIPWDGLYDINLEYVFTTVTQVWEFNSFLQVATTSDTGYGAIAFNSLIGPSGHAYSAYYNNTLAAPNYPTRMNCIHTNIEFHANDLLGVVGQVHIAAGSQNSQVEAMTVRWVNPLPNNKVNIGTRTP